MSESLHVLVVRAGGLPWALPMDSVEQAFELSRHTIHDLPGSRLVVFRGDALEVIDTAARLGLGDGGEPAAAAIVWAGGRRRAFGVERLIGQMWLECAPVPPAARGPHTSGVVLLPSGEVVPVLEPGVVAGAWAPDSGAALGFTEMQRSALLEIANIGSGHAATALSELLGKPVEIGYAEALLATVAEAADRIGSAASPSAVVDTPVADGGGKVLLLFPDGAGEQLCELLGTTLDDEMGRSSLREVGNILASSYLTAIVDMTGMELEPEPPEIEVDLLGSLVQRSLAGADPHDPTVLMRSVMTIEASDARFAFLFVPRLGAVESLLEHLGVGSAEAA
jgi:chemotaxis protein CheC